MIPYPELPRPGRSWSHAGTELERAGVYGLNVPAPFYDRLDNLIFMFQRFDHQRAIHRNLPGDLLQIPGSRAYVLHYHIQRNKEINYLGRQEYIKERNRWGTLRVETLAELHEWMASQGVKKA